jgi:hypothetical protein
MRANLRALKNQIGPSSEFGMLIGKTTQPANSFVCRLTLIVTGMSNTMGMMVKKNCDFVWRLNYFIVSLHRI